MKIGIISNIYPPFIRGGAEVIAAMQAEGLKKNWQHVFAISTRPNNVKVIGAPLFEIDFAKISHDEINEVSVFRFTPFNIYYYLDDFKHPGFIRFIWHILDIFNLFSYFAIKKILAKEKPDVIITHNIMGIGFLIPLLLRRLKIKHVHVVHDVQLVSPSGLILQGKENAAEHKFFKYLGYIKLMKKLFASPAVVISPSKFLLDFYNKHNFFPKSKKVVLANPTKGLMNIKNINSYSLEVLYLGQINKAKGVLELIKTVKGINIKHINLHVVGVGTEFNKAKELGKRDKRIKFHGWLRHGSLVSLLAKADVLIVPSLCYENSPAVISEALSMGMPVVAADIGGAAELITEGKNGWKFPAGDFNKLRQIILGLYKQRDKLALMKENCQNSVKDLEVDKYTEKLLSIINE